MELKKYQEEVFNKLLKHDKTFIFWSRQMGKSYLIEYYLNYFINNKINENIIYFTKYYKYCVNLKNKLLNYNIVTQTNHSILFKNNITLRFCKFEEGYAYTLRGLLPSLIIFDEFSIKDLNGSDLIRLTELIYYINTNKCKIIFISTHIDIRLVRLMDGKNDYYINVMQNFEILKNSNNISGGPIYNTEYLAEFGGSEYRKILEKEFSYKPFNLLDFNDLSYQRKCKLKILREISNNL